MINASEHYTDSHIIERILKGESQLYELLIRRNNPFLYRIGRTYGYNHQDTEDLMQETYINAYHALSKFEGKASFKTWISRIMLNQCYQKKQRASSKEMPAGKITEKNNPMFHQHLPTEQTVLNRELGHVLENALGNIPEDYRLVFTLRELNGLTTAEAAEATGFSEANIKVRLNRAKGMLKTEIEKMYQPADIYEFNLVYCDRMVERVMAAINLPKT